MLHTLILIVFYLSLNQKYIFDLYTPQIKCNSIYKNVTYLVSNSLNENTNKLTAKQVAKKIYTMKSDIQTVVGYKCVGSNTIEINPQKAKKI